MKRILLITAVLIILLIFLLIVRNQQQTGNLGITIRQNEAEKMISFQEIKKLAFQEFRTARNDEFTGVLLTDLMKQAEVSFEQYIILQSADGASLRLPQDLIESSYLIWQNDTSEQALRLIIPADEFGQRWMKFVQSIEVH